MNNIEPLPVTVQKTIGKPTFDSSENIRKGKFRLEFSDITNSPYARLFFLNNLSTNKKIIFFHK